MEWSDNYLCYSRDRVTGYSGRWVPAAPPCPTCAQVDYSVTHGIEKGQEIGHETSFAYELSIMVGIEAETKVGGVGVKATTEITNTFNWSWTDNVVNSISRSMSEEISLQCPYGALWQWVSKIDRSCAFVGECPALNVPAEIYQCTVPGNEPIQDRQWEPCEPVFVSSVSSTTSRAQNAGMRSDVPGGWRCREKGEVLIEQATFGRNCGAELGNVTDVVARVCRVQDGAGCQFPVDANRLGDTSRTCKPDFEVSYTCDGDGDVQRSVYMPNGAIAFPAILSCRGKPGGEVVAEAPPEGEIWCAPAPSVSELDNGRLYLPYASADFDARSCVNSAELNDAETSMIRPPVGDTTIMVGGYTESPLAAKPGLWTYAFLANGEKWDNFQGYIGTCTGGGCVGLTRGDYVLCQPDKGECLVKARWKTKGGKSGTFEYLVPHRAYKLTEIKFKLD